MSTRFAHGLFVIRAAALLIAATGFGLAARAEDQSAGDDNLDGALLEDLGAEPTDRDATADDRPPAVRDLDERLTRDLVDGAGEDIGAGQGGSRKDAALAHITGRMRQAETLLKARDASGPASAAQREAVTALDVMIEQLRKKCSQCGGQCNKPPSPGAKPPKPGAKQGAKPGQSSANLNVTVVPADREAIGALVKDLWGSLPERQRDELLQPLSEEFLPGYAADIEEYFRSLAQPPADEAAEATP